jgi:hypothetical protein
MNYPVYLYVILQIMPSYNRFMRCLKFSLKFFMLSTMFIVYNDLSQLNKLPADRESQKEKSGMAGTD